MGVTFMFFREKIRYTKGDDIYPFDSNFLLNLK